MRSRAAGVRLPLPSGAVLLVVAVWSWAIWSCAEHWRGNANYSYGWVVPALALGFAARRFLRFRQQADVTNRPGFGLLGAIGVSILLLLAGAGLEYARESMWHPEIVLWTICLLAVAVTLLTIRGLWGTRFAREEAFPVLFFLSAVPWPPRFEQPLTASLMRWVAEATTEVLHWLGVEAVASGGAIALRSGLVGITEACSGIRSLQAGIMFGLAMGEWFLLKPGRRVLLLSIAVALALLTNLGRTLALSLRAEWSGAETVAGIHDLTGNIAVTALVFGIAIVARLLKSPRPALPENIDPVAQDEATAPDKWNIWSRRFALAAAAVVIGIAGARFWYAHEDGSGYSQTAPRFIARVSEGANKMAKVPKEVWDELRPTTGEYVERRDSQSDLPVDCFHFFWKPSVWNRFALVHRPDICMPGIGWNEVGRPEPVMVSFRGRQVPFYLFHFQRGNAHALEIWGAWRNGDAVPLDYTPEQVLGTGATPAFLKMNGKRRSATEILACSLVRQGGEPSRELALALLPAVFDYNENE